MIDLPLAMVSPPTSTQERGQSSRSQDPEGFATALASLLGDAGREVAEMVQTLDSLTEMSEREELATVGWPLPALLALTAEGRHADGSALLGQLADVAPDGEAISSGLFALAGLNAELGVEQLTEMVRAVDLADQAPVEAVVAPEDEPEQVSVEAPRAPDGRVVAEAPPVAAAVTTTLAGQTTLETDPEVDPEVEVAPRAAERASAVRPVAAEASTETTRVEVPQQRQEHPNAASRTARVPAGTTETNEVPGDELLEELTGELTAASAKADPAGRSLPRAVVTSPAVQRIMEAVERLENLPPPRQLTLELGDLRLRVSMEDGQVRLTLLDAEGDAGQDLLQDARDELAQRGFDLSEERSNGDEAQGQSDRTPGAATDPGARARTRREPVGSLRL